MDIRDIIGGRGKGAAAAGAYKFKKSTGANDAEKRKPIAGGTARKRSPRMDSAGNTGFGASSAPAKPKRRQPMPPSALKPFRFPEGKLRPRGGSARKPTKPVGKFYTRLGRGK
jgi:hypothetical protein